MEARAADSAAAPGGATVEPETLEGMVAAKVAAVVGATEVRSAVAAVPRAARAAAAAAAMAVLEAGSATVR